MIPQVQRPCRVGGTIRASWEAVEPIGDEIDAIARVRYEIDARTRTVRILDIDHRRDAYRP